MVFDSKMVGFFVMVGILIPFGAMYVLFRLSFGQIRGWLNRALLISVIDYLIWVYFFVFSAISSCMSGACSKGEKPLYLEGLGNMGFGFGMLYIVPLYCLINGLLFATKKSLKLNPLKRFFAGFFIAFVIWFIGALILGQFGLHSAD
ncbi:MAG: hypothetical protein Q7S45_00445 [Candidatus Curtissbacteria bacterium]|nr:hypothetical protein [Candidatus Curtissbacteria bacterium]